MNFALREGLTYSPRWFDPQEGAYTALAKIAIPNRISFKMLRHQILGARYQPTTRVVGQHNLTCLTSKWMIRAERASAGTIARDLSERTLSGVFGEQTLDFAGDEHFRYCPACLDLGFQSPLCQIDALVRCPIHRAPILDHCRHCKHPTGRYAFDSSFLRQLRCTNCEEPLGRAWGEDACLQWPVRQDTRPYGALANVFKQIRRLDWIERRGWDEHFDLLPASQKRIANFAFAVKAQELGVPLELLHPALSRVGGERLRMVACRNCSIDPSSETEIVFRELWAEYRQEVGIAQFAIARVSETIKIASPTRMVEWVGSNNSPVLAGYLWCNRFCHWAHETEIHLRKGHPRWSRDCKVSRDNWRQYFLLARRAEERFATKWCEATRYLQRQDSEWRELVTQHAAILRSRQPQSMGIVTVAQQGDEANLETRRVSIACELGSNYFPLL
jgi:hypothetical protein